MSPAAVAARAELIARFSAAWAAGDVDALMDMMADDCTFRASVGPEPGETFAGRDQVRLGFERFLSAASAGPPGETISEEPLVCEDFAVTRWTTRQPADGGPPRVVRACDVLGFEGERIKFKDTYRKQAG